MNDEVVINLFKKVARILEDDKQYEWLADEVKDYLNEIYVNKAFEPEQEPIDFDLDRMKLAIESSVSDVTVEGLIDKVKSNRVFYQEGYAQAELDLKREPLSDDEMRAIWKEGVRGEIPFVEIGRAIEKAHGIGGGE